MKKTNALLLGALLGALALAPGVADAQSGTPNILVIWGDDIGITNVSAYMPWHCSKRLRSLCPAGEKPNP